jgi:fucose 4-O-acetylase-like acetyltransferase
MVIASQGRHHRRLFGHAASRPDRVPSAAAHRPHLGGEDGQIYVPWINWALLVSVLTLVVTFKSSAALAYAFGMVVTGTVTTMLFFYIARYQWRWSWWIVAPAAAVLPTVDLLFFAANRFQYEPYARRVPSLTAGDTTGAYLAEVGTGLRGCDQVGRGQSHPLQQH